MKNSNHTSLKEPKKGQYNEYSYQHLSSVLSMGNIEFFTLTVLLANV